MQGSMELSAPKVVHVPPLSSPWVLPHLIVAHMKNNRAKAHISYLQVNMALLWGMRTDDHDNQVGVPNAWDQGRSVGGCVPRVSPMHPILDPGLCTSVSAHCPASQQTHRSVGQPCHYCLINTASGSCLSLVSFPFRYRKRRRGRGEGEVGRKHMKNY